MELTNIMCNFAKNYEIKLHHYEILKNNHSTAIVPNCNDGFSLGHTVQANRKAHQGTRVCQPYVPHHQIRCRTEEDGQAKPNGH